MNDSLAGDNLASFQLRDKLLDRNLSHKVDHQEVLLHCRFGLFSMDVLLLRNRTRNG